MFGINEVQETTLPEKDASEKYNSPKRLRYFLEVQNHAQLYYETPGLSELAVKFAEYGGKLVFCPYETNDLERDNFKIGILPSDLIYPICHDGFIRSQIMYLVLQGLKRKIGTEKGIVRPHGAKFGFDPYNLDDQYTFQSVEQLNNNVKALFENSFGQPLEPRFGEDKYGPNPNINYSQRSTQLETKKIRETLQDIFTLKYYHLPTPHTGRIIILAFGASLPIVLTRLMESNTTPQLKSSKLTVYALPFDSHKKISNKRDMEAAYQLYSSLFIPIAQK